MFVRENGARVESYYSVVHFNKSQSLSAIMEAACWRSSTTFAKFYLRDLASITAGLCLLGPIVAAQRVVSLADK